jgi:hypothetical protein
MTKLSERQKLFLFYLENVRNPAPREVINAYLKQWGYDLDDCGLRAIKRGLLELGYSIGSSREKGYFIIYEGDDDLLQEALAENARHIQGGLRMDKLLRENVHMKRPPRETSTAYQPELFPAI